MPASDGMNGDTLQSVHQNTNSQGVEAPREAILHEGREVDIIDSEDDDNDDDRRLLILYASQTGSAQDVAEYIGREAWRRHFKARVQDVHDFDKVKSAL